MSWIVFGLLTLIVLAALLWPLLSARAGREARIEHDLEVYRDQLKELEAELARGEIAETDAGAARREIERRILRAAEQGDARQPLAAGGSLAPALLLIVLVPAAAVALYLQIGHPDAGDQPIAARADAGAARAVAGTAPAPAGGEARSGGDTAADGSSIDDLAGRLAAKLKENPQDRQGWILLGRTYWELQRHADAAAAYANAVALDPDDANLQVAYGEALMFAARGQLIPAAQAAFRKASEVDPSADAPRFYLAEADFRAGRVQEAYDRWLALAADLPANSGGLGLLLRRLGDAATQLGRDLTADLPENLRVAGGGGLPAPAPAGPVTAPADGSPAGRAPTGPASAAPGPTREQMAAAGAMSAEDRGAFIRSMVGRLAARLEENPDDVEGWLRLGRSYGVLEDRDRAADAYARAQALRPEDPEILWLAGQSAAAAGRQMVALGFWQRLRDGLEAGDPARVRVEEAIGRLQQQ